MKIIGQRISQKIVRMKVLTKPEDPDLILSRTVDLRLVADVAAPFTSLGFDLSKLLLTVCAPILTGVLIELPDIFGLNLMMYAWILLPPITTRARDDLKALAEDVVL
jgi:hypothetical protein